MTDPSAAGWVATKESGKVAAVWTSSDGGTWSLVAPDDAAFGGPDGQLMFSVVEGVRGWSPSALTAKGVLRCGSVSSPDDRKAL